MQIPCEIIFDDGETDDGRVVECTYAVCSRCKLETMAYGTGAGSVSCALAMLRDECPRKEKNFYMDEDEIRPA